MQIWKVSSESHAGSAKLLPRDLRGQAGKIALWQAHIDGWVWGVLRIP